MELRTPSIGIGVGDRRFHTGFHQLEESWQFAAMQFEPAGVALAIAIVAVQATQNLSV